MATYLFETITAACALTLIGTDRTVFSSPSRSSRLASSAGCDLIHGGSSGNVIFANWPQPSKGSVRHQAKLLSQHNRQYEALQNQRVSRVCKRPQ